MEVNWASFYQIHRNHLSLWANTSLLGNVVHTHVFPMVWSLKWLAKVLDWEMWISHPSSLSMLMSNDMKSWDSFDIDGDLCIYIALWSLPKPFSSMFSSGSHYRHKRDYISYFSGSNTTGTQRILRLT